MYSNSEANTTTYFLKASILGNAELWYENFLQQNVFIQPLLHSLSGILYNPEWWLHIRHA